MAATARWLGMLYITMSTYRLLVETMYMYIAGFALPIAIVAKCEERINLAQKILIWRQLLAKEKSRANFFVWHRNRHLRLQVIASCRLMVINVYLNCQLTSQLSTTQFSSWSSQTWTRADNLGPSINVYWVRVITYGDRHTLLTAATGNGYKSAAAYICWYLLYKFVLL